MAGVSETNKAGLMDVTRVGCYGVVIEDRRILLVRVSELDTVSAGKWTLPGGGIDFGEQPDDAVRREVREETGLEFEPAELVHLESKLVESPERRMHAIRLYYFGRITGGYLCNEMRGSTDLCEWVDLQQASELPLTDIGLLGLGLASERSQGHD